MRQAAVLLALILAGAASAQTPDKKGLTPEQLAAAQWTEPRLRLELDGFTSAVTALAFSPDGKTLYAAGFDKVVRVWQWDGNKNEFVADRKTFRVPIGPGTNGAINAMAVSADGNWLAVGGLGMYRGHPGYDPGLVVPVSALSEAMWKDRGKIYAFRTSKPGVAFELTGHLGPVIALTFVQDVGRDPLLVSAARDWDMEHKEFVGSVQLWDVKAKESKGWLWGGRPNAMAPPSLRDPGVGRPALTAWRAGDHVRIGIGWDDASFRLWAPDQKKNWTVTAPGSLNNTAVILPGGKEVLATDWEATTGSGYLRTWKIPEADAPTVARQLAKFPFDNGTGKTPYARAVSLLASAGDGSVDYAAVTLCVARKNQPDECMLQMVPLDGKHEKQLDEGVSLWKGNYAPAVAAAPSGSHVAVAGDPDHSIHVYAIADLLKGQAGAVQKLRTIGTRLREAVFVTKEQGGKKQLGLVLTETAKKSGAKPHAPVAGDQVFDFTKRSLTEELAGWNPDAPDPGAWSVKQPVDNIGPRPEVVILDPKNKEVIVKLPSDKHVVTDYAFLPPRAPINVPLLAVATVLGLEPYLFLYHGISGDLLCNMNGHQGPIRSVVFSGDGRLLVSTADDQTVCVWSLYNFEHLIDKKGQMRGVVVQPNKQGKLAVAIIDPDVPAAKVLNKDDVIEGVVMEGKLRRMATGHDLYNELLLVKPGQNAILQLGNGKQVNVPMNQAILERTPLMQLFITRGAQVAQRRWIAWHPLGPYDSSDPGVARLLLGWHWNIDPQAGGAGHVKFAPIETFRAEERREGLVPFLLARGTLSKALDDWKRQKDAKPLPPPEMTLGVDGLDRGLLRDPQAMVRLRVEGVPKEAIEVQWQIDGGKPQAFEKVKRIDTALDYAQPAQWTRGKHIVQVKVQVKEPVPQAHVRQLAFTYQPSPPTITPRGQAEGIGDKGLTVDKDIFLLEADVAPSLPGEEVAVQLFHQQRPVETTPGSDLRIKREMKLAPGDNRIEIVAVNKRAPAGAQTRERSELVLNVRYMASSSEAVAPPLIALEEVAGVTSGEATTITPGQPVVVHDSRIKVAGKISATRELSEAKGPEGKLLQNFVAGKAREFAIAEEVVLQPGMKELRFSARAGQGQPKEVVLNVEYRPALPGTEIAAEPPGPMFDDDGKGAPEVLVTGQLFMPRDEAAAQVKLLGSLLRNDKESFPASIDLKSRKWQARVRLEPGVNRFQVKLNNGFDEAVSGDLQLFYLRPPRNVRAVVPAETNAEMLDVVAQIDSALELNPRLVRATVNRKPVSDVRLEAPTTGTTWTAKLKVPLQLGSNEVVLDVSNADGICPEPGAWKIERTGAKVKGAPPVVAFVEPVATTQPADAGLRVSRTDLPVTVRVRSVSPLRRVTLSVRRDGAKDLVKAFDVAKTELSDGTYELRDGVDLRLAPGITTLALEAENASDVTTLPPLLVNYITPPLRVVFTALEPDSPGEATLPISEAEDTKLETGKGKLYLEGRVVWEQPVAEQLKRPEIIAAYVNGAQQWREELDEALPGKNERIFKVALVLNRTDKNEVEVEFPGLRLEENASRMLAIACKEPMKKRMLHVQMISPGEANDKKLVSTVLTGLHGTDYKPARGDFKRSGFNAARLYPSLSEDVDDDQVRSRLLEIRREIAKRADAGEPNDVLLVYYVGGEARDRSGKTLTLTYTGSRRPLITRPQLEKMFGDMIGVKVLLLDVKREDVGKGGDLSAALERQVKQWLDPPPRHGWLRNAWFAEGEEPGEARLSAALHDTLDKADSLREVVSEVDRRVRQMAARFATVRLEFDYYLPKPLAQLPVGAGR